MTYKMVKDMTVFPFYEYLKKYEALEYFPLDQGGRLIQLALIKSEADQDTIDFIRDGNLERLWGNPIVWDHYEIATPREIEKHVWLHRWYFLLVFARQYFITGDRSYLDDILAFCRNWHAGNPPPPDFQEYFSTRKYTWKDMQVAWRTIVMTVCYYLGGNGFSPAEKLELEGWIGAHGAILLQDFGRQKYRDADNHQAHGGLAMMAAGVLFPRMAAAEQLAQKGLAILNYHLDRAFFPDGNSIELSPGYYPFIASIFRDAYLIGKANRLQLDPSWEARLAQCCRFMRQARQPDGTMPPVNDSTEMPCMSSIEILSGISSPDGNTDDQGSTFFRHSHQAVMRNRHGGYIFLDAGREILWHGHAGKLGFHLWWNGVPLLGDSGVCNYDDPLRRNWYITAPAHNTIIVDGKDDFTKNAAPGSDNISGAEFIHWQSAKDFDYAVMEHSGWERLGIPVRWRRHLVMIKNDFAVVVDCLESKTPHEYHWIFHPLTRTGNANSADKSFLLQRPDTGLLLAPFEPAAFTDFSIDSGFINRAGRNVSAPTVNYSARANSITASYILFPAVGGSRPEIKLTQRNIDSGVILTVQAKEKTWRLKVCKNMHFEFEALEMPLEYAVL